MSNIQHIAAAEVGFGLDVYNELIRAEPNGNAFFSPLSLLLALAMTLLGAQGLIVINKLKDLQGEIELNFFQILDQTASEMKSVLHLDKLDDDAIHEGMKLFHEQLLDTKDKYTLNIANKIFFEKSENFLSSFNESCHKFYGSELQLVDFKNKASECELIVNNWVQQKTNDKIKNLIPQGTFNELTTIVLVNALHFKGSWHKQFRKSATADKNFKISQDQTVSAPFMNFNNEKIKYYYDDVLESQVLEIPFTGNAANFIVILPNLTKTSLPEMEEKLTSDVITKISEKLSDCLVTLSLPKFKLETKPNVLETLKKLGMSELFSVGSCDLSKINGRKNLYVSDVKQKAFIEINEEGVEAAAATAVIGMRTSSRLPSLPHVEVNADHPFVFLIRENTSGAVLFMGRLNNPK